MIADLLALIVDLTFLEEEEEAVTSGGGWLRSSEICFRFVGVIDLCH